MTTLDSNVIEMDQARVKIRLRQQEEQFKKYLGSLKQDQLQYEANYLLNMASTGLDDETLMKSALLMEELAKRISADKMSDTITAYAEELRRKTEKSKEERGPLQ
jgi:hypothetical protein